MKPVFQVEEPSFLGISAPKLTIKNPKLFGKISRLYIDGELETWAKYDICQFIDGEIIDSPKQDAILINQEETEWKDCQLIMIKTNSNKSVAFLVSPGEVEEVRAKELLTKQYIDL